MTLVNNEEIFKARGYLLSQSFKVGLTPEQQSRLKMIPNELYLNTKFTLGGTVNLLHSNATKDVGVTNFDGNRLEPSRYFVVNGLTIQYVAETTDKKVFEVEYTDELPAVLKASNFILKVGDEVVCKLPISAIQNAKKSDNFYRFLGTMILIEPERAVEICIEAPNGASLVSGKHHYVKVLLRGYETNIK